MTLEERRFTDAAAALRPALRIHCYRMLGSAHDSEDLVQETLLRAWRARATLTDPSRIRPWLYRIATNACLDELAKRPRRALASELFAPSAGEAQPSPPTMDDPWLEPMPAAWLVGIDEDPGQRYSLRESVRLAFVAILQELTPPQRATLLLRDVAGMTAEETAAALGQSLEATHSVLHRARATIEDRIAHRDPAAFGAASDEAVIAEYVRAIAEADVDAMIALVHHDMHTTMPPSPTWIRGYPDNVAFYRKMFERWSPGTARIVPVGVNDDIGLEFYRDGELRAIEVLELRDGKILRMHHFMQTALLELFRR